MSHRGFSRPTKGSITLSFLILISGCLSEVMAQATTEGQSVKALRLRSFIPTASGSLYMESSPAGGIVRITTLGLPRPDTLLPDAQLYTVWIVAPGKKPGNVGQMKINENGNGGLEFNRPNSFEDYSVVVTAETNPAADSPKGVMALASRRGAIRAFYGGKSGDLNISRIKSLEQKLRQRDRAVSKSSGFFSEVVNATNTNTATSKTLELLGEESSPAAYGIARVAHVDDRTYIRLLVDELPSPSALGASTYILWGIEKGGHIIYMGSMEVVNLNEVDEYVRLGRPGNGEFDLAVSAEMKRPAPRPSGLRILTSDTLRAPESKAYGAIMGRVLDKNGNPLRAAIVEISPVDQPAGDNSLPSAVTDEEGRFFLDGIPPGKHLIYASKEEEGYPSTFDIFFVDPAKVPRVNVENNQVTENIEVRMGSKAALFSGTVRDAKTGRPVQNVEITLSLVGGESSYLAFGADENGGFERLVPAVPLFIKVSAPGYRVWVFGKDGANGVAEPLTFEPDATKELTVNLDPK